MSFETAFQNVTPSGISCTKVLFSTDSQVDCHLSFYYLFVGLFVVINLDNPYFASLGSKLNPWEYIHSGRVALPAVLLKVHHRPETRAN